MSPALAFCPAQIVKRYMIFHLLSYKLIILQKTPGANSAYFNTSLYPRRWKGDARGIGLKLSQDLRAISYPGQRRQCDSFANNRTPPMKHGPLSVYLN